MSITPKNWHAFQHYKDRAPAWIKLHRGLLDDYAFACLPDASRALAPMLWLLASEYTDGTITATNAEIAFRLRMTEKALAAALKPLLEQGFFVLASNTLADCKRDAILEKEREIEEQVETEEEKDIRSVAIATRPEEDFDKLWTAYPKRQGSNPKTPARKKFFALVKSGVPPEQIIRAAGRYRAECAENKQIGTPYVAQMITWLNQERFEDYAPVVVSPTGPPRTDLPSDEELRRKYGRNSIASAENIPDAGQNWADRTDHASELLGTRTGDDPGELSRECAGSPLRNP